MNNPRFYRLGNKIHTVIAGNSRPECAFNDSLITGTQNISLVAEPYIYTYTKLRKLLVSNPGIKRVVIEVSDISLSDEYMQKWMYEFSSVRYLYPKYFNIMTLQEMKEIFSESPVAVLKSFPVIIRDDFFFTIRREDDMFIFKQMGGFREKPGSNINKLAGDTNSISDKAKVYELAEENLLYLDKIVDMCRQKSVHLFFLRSPVHKIYGLNSFSNQYDSLLQHRYSEIVLLDFANFKLKDTEYFDAHHLNSAGAVKVSKAMDSLINVLSNSVEYQFANKRLVIVK